MKHLRALSKAPQLGLTPGRIDQLLLLLRLYSELVELGIIGDKKGEGS